MKLWLSKAVAKGKKVNTIFRRQEECCVESHFSLVCHGLHQGQVWGENLVPVRIVGHRDVLPMDAVGSLNGFVKAGLGVHPSDLGQELGLSELLRPSCSGIHDYLPLGSPCHQGSRLPAQQ